jgi:purine-binding chemotaxis protein CheW
MSTTQASSFEPESDASRPSYLTFFIGNDEYGVPILRAREILRLASITAVPSAPACIRGVINLRGTAVPVADLAIKFGQPACVPTRFTCIVVVEVCVDGEQAVMGLMVDAVNQTIELSAEEIEPVPNFGTHAPCEHLVGMGKQERKFVLLLDIDRVLSDLQTIVPTARKAPADGAPKATVHNRDITRSAGGQEA